MNLHLDIASCVRATSKFSQCTKCVDACPESIQLVDNLPTFAKGTGVEAAACVGACPTEAFALSDFSTTEFFFTFLESKVRLVSPKINVPCLSVLSIEHLISLALASEEPVTLDLSSYDPDSELFDLIEARIEEANFILSSISTKQLETNIDTPRHSGLDLESQKSEDEILNQVQDDSMSRRSFLGNASLKGVMKHKREFDEAVEAEELRAFELDGDVISKIKEKNLPDKRKILFTTLKRIDRPEVFDVLATEDISFISQKYVDEKCTNCQICYRICPTGALSSDKKFSLIHFDAMLCVKCHLCHDVCEPDAIHLQEGFELKEFFEPQQRTLATFTIKRCNECGNSFTYTGGEQTCPRCLVEEEEAMFLHNNARHMRGEE
ncbi:4Fe-4S binding protein [Sulfurovum mangrovi]|uniref:4Fe-4S binding protein n=1 Tax=Sulfurovum mangrovi TaxID=2893889 RepID=UPI001E60571D|nr:4Fe-4S dicluster domain-containing protein [Sulfurovum mangrovi]UFH59736.1 4Fe-4S binding protein [Sulfurovum mangrovi]UFH60879.1 4Fe-4S binding protein [Sulfurovum mangrovi]